MITRSKAVSEKNVSDKTPQADLPLMFEEAGAANKPPHSTHSFSSAETTSSVRAQRLAVEARHAAALVQIEEERLAQEKRAIESLTQLKLDAQNRILAAELANLERNSQSRSRHSKCSSHCSLEAKFLPARLPIPKAVGPLVTFGPANQPGSGPGASPMMQCEGGGNTSRMRDNTHLNKGYNDPLPSPSNNICSNAAPITSSHHCGDIKNLAQAIVSLGHKPRVCDLPSFSGRATDWLAFKQIYMDTYNSFSPPQNVARIRTALRGEAAQAVSALALTCSDPSDLLQALEERFARPEFVVLEELAAVRALPRLQTDFKDLNTIACRLQNLVATIKHLGRIEYLYSPELFNTILSKLTPLLRSLWTRYAAEHATGGTKLELLADFLREEARHHTEFGLLQLSQIPSEKQNRHVVHCNTARIVHDSGVCGFCKGKHVLADCSKFRDISPDERIQLIFNSKRCFRCLGNKRHVWRSCQGKKCDIDGCQSFHHRLLHGAKMPLSMSTSTSHHRVCQNPNSMISANLSDNSVYVKSEPVPPVSILDRNSKVNFSSEKSLLPAQTLDSNSTYACSDEHSHHKRVLLKVLPVVIEGPLGEIETFALLDDGSTATLLDSVIASQVGLTGPVGHIRVQGVGGMIREDKVNYVTFKIRGKYSSDTYTVQNARVLQNLDLSKQAVSFSDISKYSHVSDIAQDVSFDEVKPMVLIGAEDWPLTVARDIRSGTRSQPVATLTLLGWVIHGASHSKTKPIDFVNHTATVEETTLNDLDILIREQFRLDALGISKYPHALGTHHDRAIKILEETAHRLPDGRFEVGLPWKEDNPMVPDSYPQAIRRLHSLERKMAKDNSFAEAYRQNVNDLIKKGYAEECQVRHDQLMVGSNKFWYLPHFAVVHPKKKKIRMVHDAAAKTAGVSLNSLLLTGPDLLCSLLGILLRWREGSVALMADIKEMFPQIKIIEVDRDMQRFLWRNGDQSAPIKEYRMSSMIFGAASSPFTAIYLLNKNAKEHADLYPEASKEVQRNTYMDDYVGSVADVDQAAYLARDIVTLHKLAQFEMRGWISNKPKALNLISPELHASLPSFEVPVCSPSATNIRTLGLFWNPSEDVLSFRPEFPEEIPSVLTKRTALSHVMRLFDPLGILSPLTIHGRILLQGLWRSQVNWDEPLPSEQYNLWSKWYQNLSQIQNLKLPRWHLFSGFVPVEVELHIFADASESAYACVAYWRFIDAKGVVHLSLIASKARVTPNKPVSIPRLELQAALLAVRLAVTIAGEHTLKPCRRFFWTDSMNVLGWLRSEGRCLKTFVANRVGEISEETKADEWHWVPSSFNAADVATRPSDGVPSCWFQGPPFLFLTPDTWPSETLSTLSDECLQEFKSPAFIHATTDNSSPLRSKPFAADPTRFSSWLRMVRATARAHQYVNILFQHLNSKFGSDNSVSLSNRRAHQSFSSYSDRPRSSNFSSSLKPLEPEDLNRAELNIIRRSQEECFSNELEAFHNQTPLERRSRLWKLSPYLDDEGVIRLRGRIEAADVPVTARRPIVLDGRHQAVRLLITHYHQRAAHANYNTVINEIRQRFWILGLRNTIRSVSLRCAWCVLRKSKPLSPPTGDLPPERLVHHRRAFTYVGLDYMGPVLVTIGRRHEKRYIALFTCFTTRAIHLEIVASLSADSALMALKRFIARRGTPAKVFSDNGTAFTGANNILQAIAEAGANCGITWVFQPPVAPHMSGVWERLVRSVKTALCAILTDRAPKEELLHTALLEAEALVNSRPLTNVPMDHSTEEALTPFHFILHASSPFHPVPVTTDNGDLLSRSDWRKSQRLADMFWSRWVREYLPSLLPRGSPSRDLRSLAVGDLVLVVDPSLPRGTWPRGRVVQVFPGRDGIVRVAEVATAGGCLRRPLTKLVKLSVSPV